MQGKYDRNIEDLERARMEDSRYWGVRQSEPGSFPFTTAPSSYGQMDPSWFIQQQRSFQQPLQHQNPYTQYPVQYAFNPTYPQFSFNPLQQQSPQQFGFQPGLPYGYPNVQSQIGFPQSGMGLSGAFSTQPMMHSQYLTQQQLPFQQLSPQLFSGVYPQPEGNWNEYAERQPLFQRGIAGRPISRIFHRPPRNYRRSDELIRDEICKRLALTPEIDATDVDVIVKDGEVTLRGTLDDRFEKRIVEDITENTFGVRDLLNEIRIGSRQHEQEFIGTTKGKEK